MRTPSASVAGSRRLTAGGGVRSPDTRSSAATSAAAPASVSHCAWKAAANATPTAAAPIAVTIQSRRVEGRTFTAVLLPRRFDLLQQPLQDAVRVAPLQLQLG